MPSMLGKGRASVFEAGAKQEKLHTFCRKEYNLFEWILDFCPHYYEGQRDRSLRRVFQCLNPKIIMKGLPFDHIIFINLHFRCLVGGVKSLMSDV